MYWKFCEVCLSCIEIERASILSMSLLYFCTATKNIITATLDLLASNDEYAMRILGNK